MDQTQIKQQLKKLGIKEVAAEIYITLLQQGLLSATKLSRRAKVPKTTVYRYLDELTKIGLVQQVTGPRGNLYKASDPANITTLLENLKTKVSILKNKLPSIISSLKSMQADPKERTQVRYYEGIKGLKQILWNSLEAREEVYGYSTLGRGYIFKDSFEEKLEFEYHKRKIVNYIIINDSKFTMNYLNRDKRPKVLGKAPIKVIPEKKFYISNDILIYNDIFAVSSWKNEDVFGFEIQNAEVVKTQLSIHKLLWQIAEPL